MNALANGRRLSRKFWSSENFGPADHFFDKIGSAGRNFLWKNGLGWKKKVLVCPFEFATWYGYPRAVANTETAVSMESDDSHHEEDEFSEIL